MTWLTLSAGSSKPCGTRSWIGARYQRAPIGVTVRINLNAVTTDVVLTVTSTGRKILAAVCALAALSLSSCSGTGPAAPALFAIEACRGSSDAPAGETFHVLIQDPDVIAEADGLIGKGNRKVLAGMLAEGDAGFNAPWGWHLRPETVVFSDVSIEVCDGCPADVQANLTYWLTLGQFCPASAVVVGRVN